MYAILSPQAEMLFLDLNPWLSGHKTTLLLCQWSPSKFFNSYMPIIKEPQKANLKYYTVLQKVLMLISIDIWNMVSNCSCGRDQLRRGRRFCSQGNQKVSVVPRWNSFTYNISKFFLILFPENPSNLIHVYISPAYQCSC